MRRGTNPLKLQHQCFTMTSFYLLEALKRFFMIKAENSKNELFRNLKKAFGISRLQNATNIDRKKQTQLERSTE